MELLIKNIRGLVQVRENGSARLPGGEMSNLPVLENAFLLIRDGRILDYGPSEQVPVTAEKEIDATGRYVLPVWVDAHTHLVFPVSREDEFVDKIRGLSYAEIAARGGGILNTCRKLRKMSEDELFAVSMQRLEEVVSMGTGVIEIKSGYGLEVENELKMLRVARRLGTASRVKVRTTLLGAHAIPEEFRNDKKGYVDLVINQMIPAATADGLADYVDVFCEKGFFSADDTLRIAEAGVKHGLKPRIHANQLSHSGGVEAGVQTGALSVDHLEVMGEGEINALKGSSTMATCLPGSAFFLNAGYPPAREMLEADIPLVIATDFNPGSAPSGSMPFMVSLACIKMRLTPEEALNAATLNGAAALELETQYGSITRGKVASVFITRPMPSLAYLPYAYASNPVEQVILQGHEITRTGDG